MRHEIVKLRRELLYKSWKSEAERLGGKKHIEVEHMSKDCRLKKKKRKENLLEITWDCRISRGTGTLVEVVLERFNWLGE